MESPEINCRLLDEIGTLLLLEMVTHTFED